MGKNMRASFRRRSQHATPRARAVETSSSSWKAYIIQRFGFFSWLSLLIVLLAIYGLFHSSFLSITTVQINGASSAIAQAIYHDHVIPQLDKTNALILTQRNLLTIREGALSDNLNEAYTFESIVITKDYPSTLQITVVERQPELVWMTQDVQYLIDGNGVAVNILEQPQPILPEDETGTEQTEEQAPPSYPIITDQSGEEITPGQEVIPSEKVSFTLEMHQKLQEISILHITGYAMANDQTTQLTAQSESGYAIYFDTSRELAQQMEKLNRVITNGTLAETPPVEYVDLRIGDRVYIK